VRWLGVFVAVVVLAQGSCGPAQQYTTLRVPAQYKTIQAAVNAANSYDLILVSPGTYRENIDTYRANRIAVRLESTDGPRVTVIDGAGKGPAVILHEAILHGFTITGGVSAQSGGGVYCRGSAYFLRRIERCIITGNRAAVGGGVYGTATLRHNLIHGNRAERDGGGAYLTGQDLHCMSNVFHHNTAGGNGGGAVVYGWRSGGIVENTLFHNTAAGHGGGIQINGGSSGLVVNTILWNNVSAGAGPELHAAGGSATTIRYSVVMRGKGGVAADSTSSVGLGPRFLDLDPRLVDPARGDFHLRATSPCFQAGDPTINRSQLDFIDVEGDPRIVFGAVDIGADEFHPHHYAIGDFRPGRDVTVNAIGPPGVTVVWGLSLHSLTRANPFVIPGVGGIHLLPPILLVPMGLTNGDGLATLRLRIPPTFPAPHPAPSQALIGYRLSNLERLAVRP